MIRNILEENDKVQPNDRTMTVLHREFPQCFNAEGKFDMAALQELLQDKVDLVKEGSGFNFLGKNYASLLSSMDTTTVLVPDTEHNEKPENKDSQNVYISGDNLDALKHLVKSYSGKIKCIYIDPPYNTGKDDFAYNDKFNFTAEELEEKLSISEEQAQRIFAMTTRGAASHAAWLTFMMPRLQYAKDLLSDDGVIFISIDDNEQANLKTLCDYVFGEDNCLGCITVIVKPEGRRYGEFAKCHEYCLVYAKDEELVFTNEITVEGASYQYQDSCGGFNLKGLRNRNVRAFNSTNRPNLRYPFYADIQHPDSNGFYPVTTIEDDGLLKIEASVIDGLKSVWRWGKETSELKKDQLVAFKGPDGNYRIFQKERKLTQTAKTLWNSKEFISNKGTAEVDELLGKGIFDFPKPLALVQQIVQIASEEDSIVLDFFGGSSTTAHAVMQMNLENGGNRKYFMVQWQEECKPDSEAAKAGYETIDQIGMERIRRAAAKIKEQNHLFAGDLGFKHYTLAEPDENTIDQMLTFEPTEMFGSNLMEKFGKDTILATYAIRDGYGLTPKFEEIKFGSYTAYLCGKHLYMLDSGFNVEEDLTDLVDKYNKDHSFPADNVVIFGYSFNFSQTDAIKKNLGAISDRNRINVDIRY